MDEGTEPGRASVETKPSPPRRRFTLFDVMVLVAASALGLAISRAAFSENPRWESTWYSLWVREGPPAMLAVCLALALVVLRMARPRPRWRRMVRQPGWVACASTLASLGLGLGGHLAFVAIQAEVDSRWADPHSLWIIAIEPTPAFVAGAWVALWLSGRWSGEKTWLDRAGRVVGFFWIASLGCTWLRPVLGHFFPSL